MASKHRFEFVAAPADLAGYVNTLYVFEAEAGQMDDVLPAYSAQLVAFGKGRARMKFEEGRVGEASEAFFLAPLQRAAPFSIQGPMKAVGVSMTALGWAATANLPVDQYGQRSFDVRDVLDEGAHTEIAAIGQGFSNGSLAAQAACQSLADVFRNALKPPKERHVRFIAATHEWLNSSHRPNLTDLQTSTGLSSRQVQRHCRRFFGLPPASLVKRYRAILAGTLTSQPNLPEKHLLEIQESYFDQAHMIRDIRRYTGRTPRILGGGEASVTSDTLAPEGYGVVDLFIGESGARD